MLAYLLLAHRRGCTSQRLRCIAPSPAAALAIGAIAYPGWLVTIAPPAAPQHWRA
jgi:hypothetical protein